MQGQAQQPKQQQAEEALAAKHSSRTGEAEWRGPALWIPVRLSIRMAFGRINNNLRD